MKLTMGSTLYDGTVVANVFPITSKYLATESFRGGNEHLGIDLGMEVGTEIYSPIEAVVSKVVDFGSENIGKGVYLQTSDNETVILGHLSDIYVKEGDIITIGEKIAESGNTGNVVGDGHLHIGMKDANGEFVNPKSFEDSFQKISEDMIGDGKGFFDDTPFGVISKASENIMGVKDYFRQIRAEGFWEATFDMSFKEIVIAGFQNLGEFLVTYNDLLFIYPAIAFMFATFLIGKNKFTKWIVPCWFAYFVTTIFGYTVMMK